MTRRTLRPVPRGWGTAYTAEVGRRLRELREQAGVSQRQLALRAGVSPAMVCLLEQGQTAASEATVAKLAAVLGMTADALLARLAGDRTAD